MIKIYDCACGALGPHPQTVMCRPLPIETSLPAETPPRTPPSIVLLSLKQDTFTKDRTDVGQIEWSCSFDELLCTYLILAKVRYDDRFLSTVHFLQEQQLRMSGNRYETGWSDIVVYMIELMERDLQRALLKVINRLDLAPA